MGLIVAYDAEGDGIGLFLLFGCAVSGHEALSYCLSVEWFTSPCMPTKLLFLLSFSSYMLPLFANIEYTQLD